MKLMNENLENALNIQYNIERQNQAKYLFIAQFLKNRGFENLGSKFLAQAKEEYEHSEIIFNLLTDMNIEVKIDGLQPVNFPINSIEDIAKFYLQAEFETTESLQELRDMATDNGVVEEKIRHMIALQQHEYSEATDFEDKAVICGNNWMNVLIWDLGLK